MPNIAMGIQGGISIPRNFLTNSISFPSLPVIDIDDILGLNEEDDLKGKNLEMKEKIKRMERMLKKSETQKIQELESRIKNLKTERKKKLSEKFDSLKQELQEAIECPICMNNTKEMMIGKCGHKICPECSQSWFNQQGKRKCPICNIKDPKYKNQKDYRSEITKISTEMEKLKESLDEAIGKKQQKNVLKRKRNYEDDIEEEERSKDSKKRKMMIDGNAQNTEICFSKKFYKTDTFAKTGKVGKRCLICGIWRKHKKDIISHYFANHCTFKINEDE